MSEEINDKIVSEIIIENEIKKIDIILSFPKNEVFKFDNTEITLRPYLTIAEKSEIIKEYVDILFDPTDDNIVNKYLCAENTLILHILDVCTNLTIDKNVGVDVLIESGLWMNVRNRIAKYDRFREDLEKVIKLIENKNAIDKSVGNVLDGLAIKITNILDQIPNLDMKEIKETADKFVSELEKLNTTVPGITKTVVHTPTSVKRGRKKKNIGEAKE
jgi:hypothetical protein